MHTDVPQTRFAPGAVLLRRGGATGLTVRSVRDHNGTLLLAFDDVADRTAAEALRGVVLEVDVTADDSADADPGADHDAWYDHELIGLRVLDPAGGELGRVVGVEHLPAQDLLEVARGDGERRLVPFVTAMVPTVDIASGSVVVDAPPGLIDDLPDDTIDDPPADLSEA